MKRIYLLLFLAFVSKAAFGISAVSNAGFTVAASTFCVPASQIIYQFKIQQTGATTTLNTVNFSTLGTYVAADITNFTLLRGTTNVYGAAAPIGVPIVAGLGVGAHSFTALASSLTGGGGAGTTYYFWIVATLPNTAIAGQTISVNGTTPSFSIANTGGGASYAISNEGVQTINNIPTAVTASAAPNPVCVGNNLTLTGTATGATSYAWAGPVFTSTLLNPAPFAVAATDAGTYLLTASNLCGSKSATTASVTVNALPAAISGFTTVCIGTTSSLTDVSGAGTWISSVPGVATIDAFGVVTGVSAGTTTIVFTLTATGCTISTLVTVTTTLPNITGPASFCQFSTTTLNDPSTGGAWTASNTTIATVDPVLGVVSGLAGGTDTITYTIGTCVATEIVTVDPVPLPGAITGTSTICVGSTTSLTDTPAGGVWVSGNAALATVDAFGNVTAVAQGTPVITYNLTNACGTTGATFMLTIEGTVKPITGYYNVCIGNNTTLSDSTIGGVWSASNGFITLSTLGVGTGINVGVDTVSYTVTNSCGTSTATAPITVGIAGNTGVISGPSVVCRGSAVSLSNVADAAAGYWSVGPVGFVSIDSFTGVASGIAYGIDTVYYSVIAVCGLASSKFILTVDTFGAPFVSITANPGLTSCQTIPITYTANIQFGGTAPTFIWKVNGTFVGVDSTYTFVPVNADTITIVMTSNYPCATKPDASNFVITTVIPKVVPTLSVIAGTLGDTVCINTLDTFFTVATNQGAAPVYQWAVNGTSIAGGSNLYYTPVNYDVITCTMFSNAVCAIPDSVKSFVVMTVDSTQQPSVTISINPSDTICVGTLVTFTAHGIYGGRHPKYTWIKNGVPVATGPSYTYYPSNLDTISCEFVSNSPCASPATFYSNKIIMHTIPVVNPIVIITANPDTIVAYGHSVTLTATAIITGMSYIPTYQWMVNGLLIPGASSNIYNINYVSTNSVYSCLVTGTGNCTSAETTQSINVGFIPSGIKQITATTSTDLVIAPNPNKGTFTLMGSTNNDDALAIEITNVVGQVLYKASLQVSNGFINQPIALQSGLANGLYLLHIQSANETKVIKFILAQ